MQRLVNSILKAPPDTFENWLRFARLKLTVSREDKGRDDVRTAFLFLAGMKGIVRNKILTADPTNECIILINAVLKSVVAKWPAISADYLIPVIMLTIPELTTEELDTVLKCLTTISDIVGLEDSSSALSYSIMTIMMAVRAKIGKMPWKDEDGADKKNEDKVEKTVKELLAEQAAAEDSLLKEAKNLPRFLSTDKALLTESPEKIALSDTRFVLIEDPQIIYMQCVLIYRKVIERDGSFSLIPEICRDYQPALQCLIEDEIKKQDLILYNKYFNVKKKQNVFSTLMVDAVNPTTEIAKLIALSSFLDWAVEMYRLTLLMSKHLDTKPDKLKESWRVIKQGFFDSTQPIKKSFSALDDGAKKMASKIKVSVSRS